MAYIKFKEMTQYFNFSKKLDINDLPQYVLDYIEKGEEVFAGYKTYRDKCVFTNKKLLLFDRRGIFGKRIRIHTFPYNSISSSAIEYLPNKTAFLLTMDSGYQLRLNFVEMNPEDKTEFRKLYFKVTEIIDDRK